MSWHLYTGEHHIQWTSLDHIFWTSNGSNHRKPAPRNQTIHLLFCDHHLGNIRMQNNHSHLTQWFSHFSSEIVGETNIKKYWKKSSLIFTRLLNVLNVFCYLGSRTRICSREICIHSVQYTHSLTHSLTHLHSTFEYNHYLTSKLEIHSWVIFLWMNKSIFLERGRRKKDEEKECTGTATSIKTNQIYLLRFNGRIKWI